MFSHNERTTTWEDPRIAIIKQQRALQNQSMVQQNQANVPPLHPSSNIQNDVSLAVCYHLQTNYISFNLSATCFNSQVVPSRASNFCRPNVLYIEGIAFTKFWQGPHVSSNVKMPQEQMMLVSLSKRFICQLLFCFFPNQIFILLLQKLFKAASHA